MRFHFWVVKVHFLTFESVFEFFYMHFVFDFRAEGKIIFIFIKFFQKNSKMTL